MEKTKRTIILPTKGICTTTPNPICSDGELEDCVNLTFGNDAIRPIQDVEPLDSITGKLMYIHVLNNGVDTNNISTDGSKLYSKNVEVKDLGSNITSVTSIGNTLIINTIKGIWYAIYRNGSYSIIVDKIPEPNVEFMMSSVLDKGEENTVKGSLEDKLDDIGFSAGAVNNSASVRSVMKYNGIITDSFTADNNATSEDINNMVFGLYAENKDKIRKKNCFCNPFFVCYALRLYDGSYTYISNPVLMLPAITSNTFAALEFGNDIIALYTKYRALYYKQTTDYTGWDDIVDNVTLFATNGVDVYNLDDNVKVLQAHNTAYGSSYVAQLTLFDGVGDSEYQIAGQSATTYGYSRYETSVSKKPVTNGGNMGDFYVTKRSGSDYDGPFKVMVSRTESEMVTELEDEYQFFKLCDVGLSKQDDFYNTQKKIKKYVVKNLTTQEQLTTLDYYSHCKIVPSEMKTFNRRLNIYGVTRSFFEGFTQFMPYSKTNSDKYYKIEVVIETPDGTRIVEHTFKSKETFGKNMWFYYPDPRAKSFKIKSGDGQKQLEINNTPAIKLKEHKGLNGAYYFGGLPNGEETEFSSAVVADSVSIPDAENLPNYLIQSEVDNPFTFFASGYVRVGQGEILGISALTTALSQDAYKVATTIVFTTQGIWALSIDSQGQYASVAPPFSREVCSNPNSITMIDKGVFFVSKKGLMLISDDGTHCVSSQLDGDSEFHDFIEFCTMAYDYRDSQLWLLNDEYDYHWVYNIKTSTFSKKKDGRKYKSVVSNYPDTILHANDDVCYSMINEKRISKDTNIYSGYIKTRPYKFDQAMSLKSIRDLKHILDMNKNKLVFKIYASNDCQTWQEVSSLKGAGFKYFKFEYTFSNLSATDSFCGTVLDFTTKHLDRIR